MAFKGYKLKQKLILFERQSKDEEDSAVSAKTIEFVLFISADKGTFLRFDEIEKSINDTFAAYSEKVISEIPPFDEIEFNIENMGNLFFGILKRKLARKHALLKRLEINESPVRTYIVNGEKYETSLFIGNQKIKVSSLLVKDLIAQSVYEITGNEADEQDERHTEVEVVKSPEPPIEEQIPEQEETSEQNNRICIDTSNTLADQFNFENKKYLAAKFLLGLALLVTSALALYLYLAGTNAYPTGADIYGHLFKSDLLYNSIKDGDLYPLYTELWYNGMQPFRYWAPMPYYIVALLQFVAGGDPMQSYLYFAVFSIIIGGLGWLLWGYFYNRMAIATFVAVLWFFMPDNMRVFFVEGNLPRMAIAMLLPYLFFFIWRFVEYEKRKALFAVIFIMCLIVLCHVMIAAMTGISTFIFLLIYSFSQKKWFEPIVTILGMLSAFAVCGFWLYPALHGGLVGMEASATAEVMQALSTPARISLNPILRNQGWHELFYFGLSILVLSIVGILLSDKKSKPGFYTAIIVFIGTTTVMVPFLEKLPLNQLLWMTRFTPIVYAIFLISVLEWRKCKRYAIILLALVLIVDCIPSLNLQRYHSQTPSILTYPLSEVKEITKQRVSLLDLSAYGSYPSYKISAEQPRTNYTFGWAWQGATTAHNIVMINTALERGHYYYLFDRSLDLGDDVVVIKKNLVNKKRNTLELLTEAAEKSNYHFYKETNELYIFKIKAPTTFGVKTKYEGLAIGVSANTITLEYPTIEEGTSNNLSDYTFEQLRKYKTIYLSGFEYDERAETEKLLTKVANSGTKVIIDMNRIPVDPITSRMTFFDVTAQTISFSGRYPELIFRNKIYDSIPFKEDYSTWNTVYLDNADNVIGYAWLKNKKLPFMATSGNDNIIFMGYNFIFHAMETNDREILGMMGEIFGFTENQLPNRKVVPINVDYSRNKIIIESEGGEINTTLGYQDNFTSKQKIIEKNNLLVVKEKKTEIDTIYPYLYQGATISVIGLAIVSLLIIFVYKRRRCLK